VTPALDIHLLGGFRLLMDGRPIGSVNSARLQSLLAYLVLNRNAPQSRYHLAFLFWPDSTEAQARANLRKLLYDLRHALPDADLFLEVDIQTVQWRTDAPFSLDVDGFESAIARARQAEQAGDASSLRAALEQAVALYPGDLLPSCYHDWIQDKREWLSQAFAGALERLMLLLESQRDYEGAIGCAQRLLRHDPLHEATYRRLMRLYALSDDRAGALRTYHACATILQREFGVGPSPATREVYERLLQTETRPMPAPMVSAWSVPLVGRAREWVQLQASWRAAAGGKPRFVLLTGEAGIGKTRLAEELLAWAERQGIPTASARCYAAEGGLAYAPVATWLRARPLPPLVDIRLTEVARLLPELLAERPDLPVPGPLAEAWQRQRLFEALARALAIGSQPLLLFLDDLQWCDRDTPEWLSYLLRFDPQARLLVLSTLRAEEIDSDHPLPALLETLRHCEQLAEIELGPLNEAETLSLAEGVAGRKLDPALAAPLYQGSEGNPLFVVEMARTALAVGGPWSAEPGQVMTRARLHLLPKVQAVIEARLAQLSPPAHELAGVAATIGREFTFAVLSRASEGDEDSLVRGLDELWRRRIVREHGADAYDFSHDRIREVAYERLNPARRRVLHRRAAQALQAVYAHDLDAVSAQVAAHYEQAGLPEQAIRSYFCAGEAARRVYANDEALRWYRQAVALLPDARPPFELEDWRRQVTAPLYEGLGDVLSLTGQHGEAKPAYERALEQLQEQDALWQARLWRKIGNVCRDEFLSEEASESYRRAEAALGAVSSPFDSDWWREWIQIQLECIWNAYWQGRLPELAERAQETQAAVERYGTTDQRAVFFHALVLLATRRERFVISEETLGLARSALAASQETDKLRQIAVNQFSLGFVHLWRWDLDEAHRHLTAALEMTERMGEADYRIRCLAYLSVLHRMRHEAEQSRHLASRCLEAATAPEALTYVGVARANLAWLAWRHGSVAEVLADGQAALACWDRPPFAYPFHWLALWPLLAAVLGRGTLDDALGHARSLIDPGQQPPRIPLAAILEDAIAAGEEGLVEAARSHLARAVELAQEMGYL
jgi:DNA-binding SARP family transcriptional activator